MYGHLADPGLGRYAMKEHSYRQLAERAAAQVPVVGAQQIERSLGIRDHSQSLWLAQAAPQFLAPIVLLVVIEHAWDGAVEDSRVRVGRRENCSGRGRLGRDQGRQRCRVPLAKTNATLVSIYSVGRAT
jgi:hypothetical protein